MKYRVHVYRVVRVPISIEASSQEEAIEAATKQLTEHSFRGQDVEDAEEITGYLVDEAGDEEYANSRTYDANGILEVTQ